MFLFKKFLKVNIASVEEGREDKLKTSSLRVTKLFARSKSLMQYLLVYFHLRTVFFTRLSRFPRKKVSTRPTNNFHLVNVCVLISLTKTT